MSLKKQFEQALREVEGDNEPQDHSADNLWVAIGLIAITSGVALILAIAALVR